MSLQESGEMYLETILLLSKRKNLVRAIDVAEEMGYSKPSVSRALTRLREENLILTNRDGYIAFTEAGRAIAEKVYHKHQLLTEFIRRLGVNEKTAEQDACRIEHVISDETFDAMVRHAEKYQDKS